jgi:hypothetical protein
VRIGGQGHGVAGRVSVIGEGCVGRRFGAPPEDVPHAAQQLFVARVARTRPATCYKETTDPVGPTVVESSHRTRACLLHSTKEFFSVLFMKPNIIIIFEIKYSYLVRLNFKRVVKNTH